MAWDEALLESVAVLGQPVLRLYGWTEPAATFGYFQKFAEVERMTSLRPLIRRPTGGGLVLHDADWTYSLSVPPEHAWYSLRAVASYRRMHEWIQTAFAQLSVAAELAPCGRPEAPGQCFAGAEQFDVVLGLRKIAGAAQRRTKEGLLIQGSIQPPTGVVREAFEDAFADVARLYLGGDGAFYEPGSAMRRRVQELTSQKFGRDEFNRRR
jgi:lipoate-protein ligase A